MSVVHLQRSLLCASVSMINKNGKRITKKYKHNHQNTTTDLQSEMIIIRILGVGEIFWNCELLPKYTEFVHWGGFARVHYLRVEAHIMIRQRVSGMTWAEHAHAVEARAWNDAIGVETAWAR